MRLRLLLPRSLFPSTKPRLKPSHRRHLNRILFLFLFLLSLSFLLSYLSLLPHPRTLLPSTKSSGPIGRAHLGGKPSRITKWPARNCHDGTWSTIPSKYSPRQFPYAIVRDAVLDRRPLVKQLLGADDPPGTTRIVLYITTHLSARHTREGSQVSVEGDQLTGKVEYVAQGDRIALPQVKGWYVRDMHTDHGDEVSEWQIGVRLTPNDGEPVDAVKSAVTADRELRVSLRVVRFFDKQGEGIPLDVRMSLQCVLGWDTPGLERREPVCEGDVDKADGSVALLAKPLHGERKRDPRYFREVADFAARALQGAARFDAVVVPVVADVPVSEMDINCEDRDTRCRQELAEVNQGLLDRIADVVEEEMQDIGVPAWAFARVLLVPTCRLGSHANGTEKEDPCSSSKAYGQFHTAFSTYAMIAPFFKWAASFDLDEFLSPVPLLGETSPVPAEAALESANSRHGRSGAISFFSLEFRVDSYSDSRRLTTDLMQGLLPRLKDWRDVAASGMCFASAMNKTGKAAVRCDRGFGFTAHRAAVHENGFGMEVRQGMQTDRELRVWHGRLAKGGVRCGYDPFVGKGA